MDSSVSPKNEIWFLRVCHRISTGLYLLCLYSTVDCSWNVITRGSAREGKWRGNWRMEWVASTLHTTSEHGVSSITTADAHSSAVPVVDRTDAPGRFKWIRPFRRKTKYSFCSCAITFQTQSTYRDLPLCLYRSPTLFIYGCIEGFNVVLHWMKGDEIGHPEVSGVTPKFTWSGWGKSAESLVE